MKKHVVHDPSSSSIDIDALKRWKKISTKGKIAWLESSLQFTAKIKKQRKALNLKTIDF